MRIIAGLHRGRRIEAPPGESTRPMLDRVRESLFSTLGNLVEDARVLDLFCGGGSLGLEALSRGAAHARLVERDAQAYATLKRNVAELGYTQEEAATVRGNALSAASWVPAAPARETAAEAEDARFDVVFLDPPFANYDDPPARARLVATIELLLSSWLRPGGVVVVHAPSRTIEGLRVRVPARLDPRAYGSSGLLYLFPEVARSPEQDG
jgi:16S rRNA (guanine966-N2)-methyltransferase